MYAHCYCACAYNLMSYKSGHVDVGDMMSYESGRVYVGDLMSCLYILLLLDTAVLHIALFVPALSTSQYMTYNIIRWFIFVSVLIKSKNTSTLQTPCMPAIYMS